MSSQKSFILISVFALCLSAIGCSAGNMSGLAPGSPDESSMSSGGTFGTSGILASVDGTGIPLADVYVDGELVSSTDEEGKYELDLEPGAQVVSFGFDDVIFLETEVDTSSRAVMDFPRPLKTGAVGGKVFGRPLKDENGEFQPIAGAIVMVIDRDHKWFDADITDEEGNFLIRHAPAGDSRLVVFARGYLPESVPIFINPDSLLYKEVFLRRAPNLGHLLGLVRDPDFNPVPDVLITLTDPENPEFERQAYTKKCGIFLINKLRPGKYLLHAEKEGYESIDRRVFIEPGKNFIKLKMAPSDDGGGDG